MKSSIDSIVVTAKQMSQIEEQIFSAGMPVAALMEKAARLCAERIIDRFPVSQFATVGILVGPGHNGGDALVIARELYLAGYQIKIYRPLPKLKELTAGHANYAASLEIDFYENVDALKKCQLMIDGLFGFGLSRELHENIRQAIRSINAWSQPIVSIDIPSGINTDTGAVLGEAIRATHTLCLGLWKRAFFQDQALEYIGTSERVDFGLLDHQIVSTLSLPPPLRQMTNTMALASLPLPRSATTYKYHQGHLLLICGSRTYSGAALLTALGARASGVGMLSIAVPKTLKNLVASHLPDALVIECPENAAGAIDSLPLSESELNKFDVIACGPGLTQDSKTIVEKIFESKCPLVLDADALNILAEKNATEVLVQRPAPTILTPHLGEFRRLFPDRKDISDRLSAVKTAAECTKSIVLLKGAKTAIANPEGLLWLISESTPALARGGSGDVLTGLTAGLVAQSTKNESNLFDSVACAAWWHAQAAIRAAKERTDLGVDALTLTGYLTTTLSDLLEPNGKA